MIRNHNIYSLVEPKELTSLTRGSNQKGVLLVYHVDDKDHLDFLAKIISSIHLKMEEVMLLELKEFQVANLSTFIQENELTSIIIFGLELKNLCLNVDALKYDVFRIGVSQYLSADSLWQVSQSKEKKKNLWLGLKEIFGV